MTVHKYATVWCDGEDCAPEHLTREWSRAKSIRWYARTVYKWKTALPGGRDLCPRCADAALRDNE